MEALLALLESAPLKCISGNCFVVRIGVIIISAIVGYELMWCSYGKCKMLFLLHLDLHE